MISIDSYNAFFVVGVTRDCNYGNYGLNEDWLVSWCLSRFLFYMTVAKIAGRHYSLYRTLLIDSSWMAVMFASCCLLPDFCISFR